MFLSSFLLSQKKQRPRRNEVTHIGPPGKTGRKQMRNSSAPGLAFPMSHNPNSDSSAAPKQRRNPEKVPSRQELHSGELSTNPCIYLYEYMSIGGWEPHSEPSNLKPSNFLELMKSTISLKVQSSQFTQ